MLFAVFLLVGCVLSIRQVLLCFVVLGRHAQRRSEWAGWSAVQCGHVPRISPDGHPRIGICLHDSIHVLS